MSDQSESRQMPFKTCAICEGQLWTKLASGALRACVCTEERRGQKIPRSIEEAILDGAARAEELGVYGQNMAIVIRQKILAYLRQKFGAAEFAMGTHEQTERACVRALADAIDPEIWAYGVRKRG